MLSEVDNIKNGKALKYPDQFRPVPGVLLHPLFGCHRREGHFPFSFNSFLEAIIKLLRTFPIRSLARSLSSKDHFLIVYPLQGPDKRPQSWYSKMFAAEF